MSRVMNILKLGRLHFLVGGFLLYALGAMTAANNGSAFGLGQFLLGYLILMCAHLSVHYSNDYFDIEADKHNIHTPFSGGSGILQENPELAQVAKALALVLIATSIIMSIGFILLFDFTPFFFIFVVFGNLFGWFYSAPPIKMAYNGMGEVATSVTIGILLPVMGYYSMAGQINGPILILLPPLFLYGVSFIMGVEIPDMEGDKAGGKNTMVVKIGRLKAFRILALGFSMAAAYFTILSLLGALPLLLAVFSYIPVLAGLPGFRYVVENRENASNQATKAVGSIFLFAGLANLAWMINI